MATPEQSGIPDENIVKLRQLAQRLRAQHVNNSAEFINTAECEDIVEAQFIARMRAFLVLKPHQTIESLLKNLERVTHQKERRKRKGREDKQ